MPKRRIEEASAERQARIDSVESVIVGVNKFHPDEIDPIEILDIDNRAVRAAQIARNNRIKKSRDEKLCQEKLAALTACAKSEDGNILEIAIQAARARATLGEISNALEKVWGRHKAEPTLVSGIYGKSLGDDPQFIKVRKKHQRCCKIFGPQTKNSGS